MTLMVRISNSPALLHRTVVRHAPKGTLAFTVQKNHVAGKWIFRLHVYMYTVFIAPHGRFRCLFRVHVPRKRYRYSGADQAYPIGVGL